MTRRPHNPLVPGSNPGGPTNIQKDLGRVPTLRQSSTEVKNEGTPRHIICSPQMYEAATSPFKARMEKFAEPRYLAEPSRFGCEQTEVTLNWRGASLTDMVAAVDPTDLKSLWRL